MGNRRLQLRITTRRYLFVVIIVAIVLSRLRIITGNQIPGVWFSAGPIVVGAYRQEPGAPAKITYIVALWNDPARMGWPCAVYFQDGRVHLQGGYTGRNDSPGPLGGM